MNNVFITVYYYMNILYYVVFWHANKIMLSCFSKISFVLFAECDLFFTVVKIYRTQRNLEDTIRTSEIDHRDD